MADRLKRILDEIEKDAALQEERILADAEARADGILSDAGKEADAAAAETLEAAKERAEREIAIAKSGAEALRKKALLAEKSRIVKEAIGDFAASLAALPDEEYFAFFLRRIEKLPDGGTVLFAAKDARRDRALFARMLKETEAKCGKTFTLAEDAAPEIGTGFLVRYGRIEENLSLEAVFAEKEDEMKDRLTAVLFRDAE